ncbi:hypothetical protein BpHYR1_039476 [Brachionus plicatilis]|uniref:Uncharacterized protein n=1 Tax=Brachionus plicatilis TaxID=10195 RepID=A0A3M7QSG8_BRAPC|nr:hypothetical protein BpHYR1_039476 [Brachionus plicatilis]
MSFIIFIISLKNSAFSKLSNYKTHCQLCLLLLLANWAKQYLSFCLQSTRRSLAPQRLGNLEEIIDFD